MQIPLPPSDNLYKFVAISGLVFVVASLLMYSFLQDDVTQSYWKYFSVIKADVKLANQLWDSAGISQEQSAEKKQAQLGKRFEAAMARLDKLMRQREAAYKSARSRQQYWSILLLFFGVIGIIMMLIGFVLWYVRVQKPQDLILAKDAEASAQNREKI